MTTATTLPGLVAGTWTIDPAHTDVSFTVRHMMVSKVRGKFAAVRGTIEVAPDVLESTLTAEVDLASLDTGVRQRDDHIRSADFFEVEKYPTMVFRSTAIRPDGDEYVLVGDLTLHGVTRPLELALEFNGAVTDPWGKTRAGFTATGQLNRKDFGIVTDIPMDGGGVVIADKIAIHLEAEATLD